MARSMHVENPMKNDTVIEACGDLRGAALSAPQIQRTSSTSTKRKQPGHARAAKASKAAPRSARPITPGDQPLSDDKTDSKKGQWNSSFISFLDDLEGSQGHTTGTGSR